MFVLSIPEVDFDDDCEFDTRRSERNKDGVRNPELPEISIDARLRELKIPLNNLHHAVRDVATRTQARQDQEKWPLRDLPMHAPTAETHATETYTARDSRLSSSEDHATPPRPQPERILEDSGRSLRSPDRIEPEKNSEDDIPFLEAQLLQEMRCLSETHRHHAAAPSKPTPATPAEETPIFVHASSTQVVHAAQLVSNYVHSDSHQETAEESSPSSPSLEKAVLVGYTQKERFPPTYSTPSINPLLPEAEKEPISNEHTTMQQDGCEVEATLHASANATSPRAEECQDVYASSHLEKRIAPTSPVSSSFASSAHYSHASLPLTDSPAIRVSPSPPPHSPLLRKRLLRRQLCRVRQPGIGPFPSG